MHLSSKFSVLIKKSNGGKIKENIHPLKQQHLTESNHILYYLYLN